MRVGIVDGFSSGANLAREFVLAGHECVSILSAPSIPDVYQASYDRSVFAAEITVQQATSWKLEAVIPGAETGVELADQLSEQLELATNGTRLSAARRSKHHMIETLDLAGIRVASHGVAGDELTAVRVADGIGYPVVVKPENSAGADGVTICDTADEVRAAARSLLGRTNQLGLLNNAVVIQELLVGDEYIVNTVSTAHRSLVCDIWLCRKEYLAGHGMISCLEELVDLTSPEASQLISYSSVVAKALEIEYGPAHFEVMLTSDGPVLIEVGARVQGLTNPASIRKAMGGQDQISLTVEAITDPSKFDCRPTQSLAQSMYHAFMLAPTSGILTAAPGVAELQQYSTYYFHQLRANLGDSVTKTTGLFTSLGFVDFVGTDKHQLELDYRRFRELESVRLFDIV